MNYWQEYNKNLESLFNEILSHNKSNTFNFLENNHYNHIRDLLALSIALNRKNDSDKYKILDYGSNIIPWTNLNNKIETSCLSVKIYDPFSNPIPFKKDHRFKVSRVRHFDEEQELYKISNLINKSSS